MSKAIDAPESRWPQLNQECFAELLDIIPLVRLRNHETAQEWMFQVYSHFVQMPVEELKSRFHHRRVH